MCGAVEQQRVRARRWRGEIDKVFVGFACGLGAYCRFCLCAIVDGRRRLEKQYSATAMDYNDDDEDDDDDDSSVASRRPGLT